MARKLTQRQIENLAEFKKQRRRIQQFKRRAEKRGYIFPENLIPEIPKTATKKDIEKLKKLTPEKLYKKIKLTVDIETGELLKQSGTERRKQERREAAKKGVETKRRKQEEAYAYFDELEKQLYNNTHTEIEDKLSKQQKDKEYAEQHRQEYTPDLYFDIESEQATRPYSSTIDDLTNRVLDLPEYIWVGYNEKFPLTGLKQQALVRWEKIVHDWSQNYDQFEQMFNDNYNIVDEAFVGFEADSDAEVSIARFDKLNEFFSLFDNGSEYYSKTLSEYNDLLGE